MNQLQIDICQRILTKLNERPIYKMFVGSPEFPCDPPLIHPTNFNNIQAKLQRSLYQSCELFIEEVERFLQSFIDNRDSNPLKAAAAKQLLMDFHEELEKSDPLKKGLSLRLNLLISDLKDYFQNISLSTNINIEEKEGEPCSVVFKTPPQDMSTKQLIREIKFLRSPDLLIRVAAFVYKKQPEAIQLGNELSIQFQFMKEETLNDLKLFVRSLIYQSAKGLLDPFKPSIGTTSPVILEEL